MTTKSTARTRKNIVRSISFDQYKSIAEDIESRLNPKFESIDTKFILVGEKIDSLRREISAIKWVIPLTITVIMSLFTIW